MKRTLLHYTRWTSHLGNTPEIVQGLLMPTLLCQMPALSHPMPALTPNAHSPAPDANSPTSDARYFSCPTCTSCDSRSRS